MPQSVAELCEPCLLPVGARSVSGATRLGVCAAGTGYGASPGAAAVAVGCLRFPARLPLSRSRLPSAGVKAAGRCSLRLLLQRERGKNMSPGSPGSGPRCRQSGLALPVLARLGLVGASVHIHYVPVLLRYPWQDLGSRLLWCCG